MRFIIILCALGVCQAVNFRIINGKPVSHGELPSQTLIYSKLLDNRTAYCGGSLIASEWVLTAAHCILAPAERTSVLLGGTTRTSMKYRTIALKVITHEDYRSGEIHDDLALIKIRTPDTKLIKLAPMAPMDMLVKNSTSVLASGFGQTESGKGSRKLMKVYLSSVTLDECHQMLKPQLRGYRLRLSPNMLCAKAEDGAADSICFGDSGGPLMATKGNRLVQVGISTAVLNKCKANPKIFTQVAPYRKWISKTIRENSST